MAKCFVLDVSVPYSIQYDSLLRRLLLQKPELIASVGMGCESWEHAINWLCMELVVAGELSVADCRASAHASERLEDVIAFVARWCEMSGSGADCRMVHVPQVHSQYVM